MALTKHEGRTIREIQQDFAENSGFEGKIIWDLLSERESHVLKTKIKQLIPDQEKGQKAVEEMRETLFDSVWAQRKYTNGNSLSALIYVFVTKSTDVSYAANCKPISCHPIFRTRRCMPKVEQESDESSANCCMLFIDETGRVYQNWEAFVENNVMPASVMVAPKNGIYTLDDNGNVILEARLTPAGLPSAQLVSAVDTTMAVTGVVAAGVSVAALAVTVAPVLIAGTAIASVSSAGYSVVRSIGNLWDRGKHEQSNSFTNRQARSSWIGIGAGTIGLGAMGATRLLTRAAAAGREVSVTAQWVANGMNISSILISGTGLGNGIFDLFLKYENDEDISSLDILQLSASLLLFTNSVNNFRMASTIITETQNSTIQSYRQNLSNRQRRMFDKLSKETIRLNGPNRGKVDIIRTANDIGNKQYLNDLHKVNKQLNQRNVRVSFGGANRGIVLNNEVSVDSSSLRANLQHNVGPDLVGSVTQPIPKAGNVNAKTGEIQFLSASNNVNSNTDNTFAVGIQVLASNFIRLPDGNTIDILLELGGRTLNHVLNVDSFKDLLVEVAELFCREGVKFIMRLLRNFIENYADELYGKISIFISSETALRQMLNTIWDNFKIRTFEYLQDKEQQILMLIKRFFESLNCKGNGIPIKCQKCNGHYTI